ncbi:MAG TPA: type I polyketide synthase, partial [Thermoanaerobaculia bacterium]
MASIANRVSYALNLHGPSVTFDTMCSSSLTAIHFACLDLKLGRTSLAIAGGVNVSIHPNKYLMLSAGQFISSDGHCQSFGEGGDGYIPGEGVGVVVLKRLSDAERDGDHIYGVIRGSSINHGGKTNGYTVPNPQAQASAIRRALAESHTDARHISYVEAHGTGTKLGDPIEIAALNKAFQQHTRDTGFCLIGSAKSNIGHCESAAGIAGLTKVLLQMQHRQIVPSLHSAQLNPHIDFDATPFTVNQSLRPWEQPVVDGRTLPRIAGISSFGAGGSNAHMVIEEYVSSVASAAFDGPVVIVLSARTSEQLRQKAVDLLSFVRERQESVDLLSMAVTLQVGREPMDERLGLVVRSAEQLVEKLQSWIAGEPVVDDVYTGQVKRNREALAVFTADADLQQTIEKWFSGRKLSRLVDLWVKGLDLDWTRLYGEARLQRMSLPVYPFARDRYWVDVAAPHATQALPVAPAAAVLHPLLHSNTSDLTQQSYRSTFSGNESFLTAQRLLPAAAYLEMARAAVEQAAGSCIELRNVVWAQPVSVEAGKQIDLALLAGDREPLGFEIYSDEVHCQGRAITGSQPEPLQLDLNRVASGELLLKLPVRGDAAFVIDPSLVENALHAALALTGGSSSFRAIDSVRILAPCSGELVAWIRPAGDQRLDVDLCDASGNVRVQLQGLTWRAASVEIAEPVVVPVSEPLPVTIERREIEFVRAPQVTPAPADRKKRAAISLSAPGAVNAKPTSVT